MKKKAVSGTVLILLLSCMLVLAVSIHSVTAEDGVFYVRADGSIEPSTAPILRDADVYLFTGDVFGSIVVERSNIIVDGNGYLLQGSRSINGFQLENVNNVTIQNVKVQNFSTAISLVNSSYTVVYGNELVNNDHGVNIYSSSYNTISRNRIADNYLRGIEIYEASEFNVVSENNITNNFRNMYISGSSNNMVSDNTITKSDYEGICLYWAPGNMVSGNTITKSNYDSIALYWAAGNNISGNTLKDNYHSVSLYGSSENTVSVNRITNCNRGIDIYSSSEANSIHGNTIADNDQGIHLYSAAKNVISGNNVTGNNRGVDVYSSHESTISGNTLTGNNYGVYLSSSSDNNISDNTITDSKYDGVYLYDSSERNTISGNIITGNYDGVYLYWSSYNIISENTITSNSYDGVYFFWSANNTISGNNIADNDFRGIFFWASSGNNISANTNTNNYDGICVHGANTTITDNTLAGNQYGIALHGSGTVISGNNITDSKQYAISLYDCAYNRIFHNNLVDNRNQIRLSCSSSKWDDGYPSGGNYLSDYTGTDSDGDGIGDTPHYTPDGGQDSHPLIAPLEWFDAGKWEWTQYYIDLVSNSSVSNFSFSPTENLISFTVTGNYQTQSFCRIIIPKAMLNSETGWTVLMDGEPTSYSIEEDATFARLSFSYDGSTRTVKVIGTDAIPEFPSWIIVPLLLIATLLIMACNRKMSVAAKK